LNPRRSASFSLSFTRDTTLYFPPLELTLVSGFHSSPFHLCNAASRRVSSLLFFLTLPFFSIFSNGSVVPIRHLTLLTLFCAEFYEGVFNEAHSLFFFGFPFPPHPLGRRAVILIRPFSERAFPCSVAVVAEQSTVSRDRIPQFFFTRDPSFLPPLLPKKNRPLSPSRTFLFAAQKRRHCQSCSCACLRKFTVPLLATPGIFFLPLLWVPFRVTFPRSLLYPFSSYDFSSCLLPQWIEQRRDSLTPFSVPSSSLSLSLTAYRLYPLSRFTTHVRKLLLYCRAPFFFAS